MKILKSFPAYDLVALDVPLVAGMEIALPYGSVRYPDLVSFHVLGSAASYAAKNGDDVEEAVERAKSLGHELHYAFALGSCIHNGPVEKKVVPLLQFGDVIEFEGLRFRLDKAPNNNVRLVEVA